MQPMDAHEQEAVVRASLEGTYDDLYEIEALIAERLTYDLDFPETQEIVLESQAPSRLQQIELRLEELHRKLSPKG